MSIADNVRYVYERIESAATRAGQTAENISLVAATKMNDAARVREAIEAGIKIIGENRVQEFLEKDAMDAYTGAERHFIGHLQRNKVKFVAGICDLIQSVDSVDLMNQISAKAVERGQRQRILLEVNIGREEAKSGVLTENLENLFAAAENLEGISVEGLMTIPPVSEKITETCNYFDTMYNLFVDIRAKKYDNINMRILSMGMSHDYEEAILSGANMVRVGTAIFGQRHY